MLTVVHNACYPDLRCKKNKHIYQRLSFDLEHTLDLHGSTYQFTFTINSNRFWFQWKWTLSAVQRTLEQCKQQSYRNVCNYFALFFYLKTFTATIYNWMPRKMMCFSIMRWAVRPIVWQKIGQRYVWIEFDN